MGVSRCGLRYHLYYDTTFVTEIVYDTVAVTDTLIIDAVLTHLEGQEATVRIKVYPNPVKTHLFIENTDYDRMPDYSLKIIDQTGKVVFATTVDQSLYEIYLSNLTGYGLYYLQVIDAAGEVIGVKKIILQ